MGRGCLGRDMGMCRSGCIDLYLLALSFAKWPCFRCLEVKSILEIGLYGEYLQGCTFIHMYISNCYPHYWRKIIHLGFFKGKARGGITHNLLKRSKYVSTSFTIY